jgi:hypothetical protein
MKRTPCITLALAICLLSSNAAQADDAVLGALIGGGAGAVVGHSVGGRNGTIIGGAIGAAAGAAIGSQQRSQSRVEYVAPPAYYAVPAYPPRAYYPPQEVYYARPVPVAPAPIYYVERGYERDHHWRHHDRDWDREDRRARGWDDRR